MATSALIICVSIAHGNTAAVANAMAAVLGADVREPEQVGPHTLADYDVVGFGSGIFWGSHHPRLRRYIEQLPTVTGTRAFVFTTAGWGRAAHLPWQHALDSVLREKGFKVAESFVCRGFSDWLPLRLIGGISKGHPNAADLSRARKFAEQIPTR